MKRIIIALVMALLLISVLAMPVFAGDGNNGAVVGEVADPLFPELGMIRYVGNHAGFHFWFTPTGYVGRYEAGKSYHVVHKFKVENPDKWYYALVPNREPYILVATPGTLVYFKIIETKPN